MAKGSFPGCLRKKITKKRIRNLRHFGNNAKFEKNCRIALQILENLRRFEDVFGSSDEDDEFHGFSSEECGLIAYKHVSSSQQKRSIPGILSSPIDLCAKNVTTRLAHARRSLDKHPSSQRSKERKHIMTHKARSNSQAPNGRAESNTHSSSLQRRRQSDPQRFPNHSDGFIKYNNSNLDFHRLSENATFRPAMSSKHSSTSKHKNSPIKPATFIAPSLAKQRKHQVTNVTPTCLKIQISKTNKAGTAQSSSRSLLVKHGRSKAKSFVLPAKSSRSSRIIKANPKYLDSDDNASRGLNTVPKLAFSSMGDSAEDTTPSTSKTLPVQGRPLLKQPTFRVAALAKINDKPQTSRLVTKDSGISTRMRARKLIKRAKFKHPTSSSTLIVGNDYDEDDMKKNLIREATFKMPTKSGKEVQKPMSKTSDLSDLGLSAQSWKKLGKNEIRYNGNISVQPWTRQEIHNLLHGAHTFANSWRRIARHYEYLPFHRDWQSIKAKLKTLQNYGLLSNNLKVKSSVLLQLKHRYSTNPNVTVFTQQELKSRGMDANVECEANSVGEDEEEDTQSEFSTQNPPKSQSVYLGLEKKVFLSLCVPQRLSIEQEPWSVREIHNIIHGFHIFGTCDWSMVHKLYAFQKTHDVSAIRTRFKVIKSKGVIVRGQVKSDVLQLLQPLLSVAGKKYYELSPRTCRVSKGVPKREPSEPVKRSEKKETTRKRSSSMNENDLKSPPRKQAYHLFGTVPVWDKSSSASGLNHLEDSLSESEQEILQQKPCTKRKSGRGRKESGDSSAKKEQNSSDDKSSVHSRGPRIKHVCRRASLVTGQNIAVYSDESTNLHLSALPKKEREKIAAEVEKHRDAPSDTTVSSDSGGDGPTTVKRSLKKSDRLSKIVGRRKRDKVPNRSRCKMCKNCQAPNCGVCDYCRRDEVRDFFCLGLPPCLNPPVNSTNKDVSKKSTTAQKNGINATSCMETRKSSNSCLYERQPNSRARPLGILLSPDSRRRLQQELQEHARQSPSIVKIDEWKERYEMEDLWTTGGVSIITSTTPSTRFLCFLCGSVGKARPMRRSSVESDSSADSIDNFDQKPLFIFCCSCCEPFHPFCLDDHEQQAAINSAKKGTWICKRCQFCNVCGRTDNLLECKRCSKTYHSNCLGPGYPNKCVRCRSCGASKPGRRPGSKWTHDFQLCQRCGDLFDKGNFCPICRRCYRDEDYESRMVQCGTCKRWVHSRCESLTNEMYALLSHLPDDVQYVCPDCDGRRSKVEIEFNNSCESVMIEDVGSDSSLEGDKMKTMLQNLPSPPWKNILENEVQSGIESVMMALFHNKEAACILKKTVQEDSVASRPVDLFAVRFAVHNRRYSSVSQFSSDVCNILDTIDDGGSSDNQSASQGRRRRQHEGGPRNAFFHEMQQVFPWFDIDTGRVKDTSDVPEDLLPHATLPPHTDHNYAQWQDRDIAVSAVGPETPLKDNTGCEISFDKDSVGMVLWSLVSNSQFDDRRQCLFCGKYGDDVPTKCELCKLPGATVGCNTRDCPQNFHFACAKLAQCSFQNDKKVFCPKHTKNIDAELVSEDGFEVARRVVVDSDEMRPNKRWQRGVQSDNVTVLMGSAIVHQLGHLTLASDRKEYLIPVHFRMTRMFWSTVHAGRKVRYTITVTEQKSTLDTVPSSKSSGATQGDKVEHGNHTISHSDEREQTKKKSSPDATACKSNLLSRLQGAESKAQGRRKSRDEHGPKAPRSRKFSGTSYTVVGLSNRTMPQIITPLPSSLVTAPTLQPQVVAKPVAARKFSIEEEIRDAVVVSHQNPYLNIQIGKVNETLQGAHNPKSGIQSDILKAMDRCVMANQQKMQQISAQSTAPPCVNMVQSQPTIKHGSSGSLICDYKDSVADTVREKSLVDSKKVLPSSEELSSVDKDMHTHTRNGENNVNQSNDPRQRFCQTHSAIITEVTVNSGTDSDSAQSLSISTVDHSRKTPLQNSTCNNISSNTEMSIKDNERGTDKYNPAKEICEPQPAIDNTLEKICSGNTVDGKKMGTLKPNVAEKICESDYDIVSTLETSCPGNASYDSATKTSNLNVAKQICEPCLPVDTTLAKSHQEKDGHCNEKESMQCNLSETISEPTPILGTALEKTCPEEVINNSETDTSNIDVAEEIFEPKPNRGSELGKNCSEKDIHRDDTPKLDLIEPIPSIDSSLEKRCSERSIHGSGTELSQLNCQQQMQEPKSSCDSRFEKNSVEEQPITVSQEAKDRNNVDTVVSGSSTLQPSTIPNTINILWKSKKNDAVAGTGPVVPKTGTEDDALISDSNISSASPSSIIITRLRKSKSIDSWSDDMFNDNTSLEEEQQSFKLQNGSVKELKVVLHDIKGVDSKIKPKYGICKTISDELLGKKDELFTDSVRSSDSSSIDSSSMPDVSSPHADIKRKSSPSRKKRLRNFAKADKSVCGNDFELITRSKRHFSSKSSEKPVSHDRFGAKSKKGTVEMCHRTNDDSASKRGRSRSYDSTWKIKQQNQENERRYPRRNPFTCLRSFSGLSPNYAIQSYSLKNTDIHDHSNLPTVKMSSSEESSDALTRPSRKNTKSARKKSNNKECNSKRKISTSQCCCVTKTEDTKNPSSTKVLQETQIASVHDDRTSSQNLDFCKRIFSAEESHSQIDNNSPSHCNITTNSAIVTSSSECDSTVSKVNPQICDDEQRRNAGDDNLKGHPDAHAPAPNMLTSLSENPRDEEFPPIEVERGIIEAETKNTPQMNVDDSDAEAVGIKEKDVSRPPLPNSPIVVFTSNNDGSFPVTSSDNLTNKNSNDVSTFCEVDECASVQTSRVSHANGVLDAIDLPATKQQPVSETKQLPTGLVFNSLVDITSPLSPRDEPNLPLPVETEATASSFLVTSECPVLNVDEVQSILAMSPTGTVTSTSSSLLPSSLVTSVSCDRAPLNVRSQNLMNSPASFQSTACVQQHYVPLNVQTFDSPYQQTPKVLMKYDGKQAYLLCRPKPVLTSPQLHTVKRIEPSVGVMSQPLNKPQAQVSYQYMQPQLVYPSPVIQPQPVYVATPATPMIPVAATPQSQRFQYPVSPNVPLPLQGNTAVNGAEKHHDISLVPKQPFNQKNEEKVVTAPISVPSTQGSSPVESYTATASQMHTLEKMIEFFSNKNNLSANEKQIVRAIIAQHIRNQSLPLPTPDNPQVVATTLAKSTTPTEDSSANNSKRKPSKTPACKKSKRPRKEPTQCNLINTKAATTDKDSMPRSPLLDIYMKVINAESSNNYSLMKKWRDNVRHLLKYHISLDLPLYARRSSRDKQTKLPPPPPTPKHAELVYEITSDDGYHAKGTNLRELVANLLDAVQECRSDVFIPPNSLCLASVISPHAFLGISQDAIRFLVEQLQGAKHCLRYKAKYYKHKESIPEVVTHINPHGCARAEKYQGRSKPDMFSFLASKHRLPPSYDPSQTQNIDMQQNSTRRPTSMDLPMAMRFRHLKTSAREAVGVYRSAIHGRGLFCKRDIEAGEMVMEYTGEVIRGFLTDRREKMYESKGIGCYMFRMDDTYVIDATLLGSGARFINHSCEPSCYSRIVSIDGKKHIIIFALRKILRGEELTYDYKFPIEAEDQKIMCNCGSKTCRKYMN